MSRELACITRKLLRRALAVVYASVGVFTFLVWVWRNPVGLAIIGLAYIAVASTIYSHVFRPLIRARHIAPIITGSPRIPRISMYLGYTASVLGVTALILSIAKAFMGYEVLAKVIPLLGLLAIMVTIVLLVISSYGLPNLMKPLDSAIIPILVFIVVTYMIEPSIVLPVSSLSFIMLGIAMYMAYKLADKECGA